MAEEQRFEIKLQRYCTRVTSKKSIHNEWPKNRCIFHSVQLDISRVENNINVMECRISVDLNGNKSSASYIFVRVLLRIVNVYTFISAL